MRFKSLHNVITVFLVSLLLLFTTEVFAENKKEKKEKAKRAQKLKNFKASINSKINLDDYNFHQKIYVLNHDFKTVWNKYSSLKPQQSWKGPLAIYKQSYSKSEDVFYESSSKNHPSLKLGNVYFIKLKINNLIKIGVTFQLTKIDTSEKFIEMTYGLDNATHGRQRIYFLKDENRTMILHISNFKSGNKFRDKHLYPKFHEKFIDEFHNNIKQNLFI
ncbi:MAG: hypothetical protein P8M12_09620 [Flavobacteriales bacterium]|nr:hypothetical protein [Flavobacteriales bacterium]